VVRCDLRAKLRLSSRGASGSRGDGSGGGRGGDVLARLDQLQAALCVHGDDAGVKERIELAACVLVALLVVLLIAGLALPACANCARARGRTSAHARARACARALNISACILALIGRSGGSDGGGSSLCGGGGSGLCGNELRALLLARLHVCVVELTQVEALL
jgi:hypothetical protein